MRSTRLILSVGWLLSMALAAPVAPIAEEPSSAPPTDSVTQPPQEEVAEADPAAPAAEPAAPSAPVVEPAGLATASPPAPAPDAVEPAAVDPRPRPARPPSKGAPTAVAAAPGFVTIEDFSFGPSSVTVGVGESVTWRNDGPSAHTATADDGSFDTGLLQSGQSRRVTFGEAGAFAYLCEPHPFMKGKVTVVAQSSTDGGDDPVSSTDDGASGRAGSAGGDGSESSAGELPATGSEPGWLAVTGLGLLLIGASGTRRLGRWAR